MVEQLGTYCGFLAPRVPAMGMLVMRCPRAPYTDVPAPSYNETDLENALALNLLRKVNMGDWEYYIRSSGPTS